MDTYDLDHSAPVRATPEPGGHSEEPMSASARHVLDLQATVGNRGTAQLLAAKRSTGTSEDRPDEGVSVSDAVGHGGGQPLDSAIRADMETSLGHDFADVRIHTGPDADASAKGINAHAYTIGNDVVFADGRYSPTSSDGRRTLAHELTHVVQQRSGPVEGTPNQDGITVSDPSDRFERAASDTAEQVVAGATHAAGPRGLGDGNATATQRNTAPDEDTEERVQPETAQRDDDEDDQQADVVQGPLAHRDERSDDEEEPS